LKFHCGSQTDYRPVVLKLQNFIETQVPFCRATLLEAVSSSMFTFIDRRV
jgi:hypothetical protein